MASNAKRPKPRYCERCGLGLAPAQTTETCPRCNPFEAELARLLPDDEWEGGPTDPLSANYVKPVAGGPRVQIPVKRMPR